MSAVCISTSFGSTLFMDLAESRRHLFAAVSSNIVDGIKKKPMERNTCSMMLIFFLREVSHFFNSTEIFLRII